MVFQTQKAKKTTHDPKKWRRTPISNKTLRKYSKKNFNNNSELGSQPPLNNHQFNFDNNSISVSPFKISRTKDEHSLIIYKNIRQVQQQLNYTNHSLQNLTQQITKISQFLFSSAPRRKIGETSKSTFSSKLSQTLSLSSSYSAKPLDQPFIILINAAKSNIQLATPIETMLKWIQLRLDKLNINGINQNKNQIQTITNENHKSIK